MDAVAPEPRQNSEAAALAISAKGPNLLVGGGFAQSLTLQDERDGATREELSRARLFTDWQALQTHKDNANEA